MDIVQRAKEAKIGTFKCIKYFQSSEKDSFKVAKKKKKVLLYISKKILSF